MSKENITINYESVEQLYAEFKTTIKEDFQEIASDYELLPVDMKKSEGEMLDAIKIQINEEKGIVDAMSKACLQLAASIETAAQSFQNIDSAMTQQMD